MIIKFKSINNLKVFKALTPIQRLSTSTSQIYRPSISHHSGWVFLLFFFVVLWANAQAFTRPPNAQAALEHIKSLLDPVRGLNSEIRVGLVKIEQTCAIISKAKVNEAKQISMSSPEVKSSTLRADVNTARQVALQQSQSFMASIEGARQQLSQQLKTCEGLPTLMSSNEACSATRTNSEILQKVNEAGSYFYAEALGRYSSYEHAFDLEINGCTRPGFSMRLWAAEKTHLVPSLKTSAQSFVEIFK